MERTYKRRHELPVVDFRKVMRGATAFGGEWGSLTAGMSEDGTRLAVEYDGTRFDVPLMWKREFKPDAPYRSEQNTGAVCYMTCPLCGGAKHVMHIYNGALGCGNCHKLHGKTAGLTRVQVAHIVAANIRARFGWPPGVCQPHGERPKGKIFSREFKTTLARLVRAERIIFEDAAKRWLPVLGWAYTPPNERADSDGLP